MGALAVGMAGQMASVAVDKVEDTIEHSKLPLPCMGPECCHASACMNVPGMRCNADRGPTKCVGSSALHLRKGVCACLTGPCSVQGKCGPPPPERSLLEPVSATDDSGFSMWHGVQTSQLFAAGTTESEEHTIPREDNTLEALVFAVAAAVLLVSLIGVGLCSLRCTAYSSIALAQEQGLDTHIDSSDSSEC